MCWLYERGREKLVAYFLYILYFFTIEPKFLNVSNPKQTVMTCGGLPFPILPCNLLRLNQNNGFLGTVVSS